MPLIDTLRTVYDHRSSHLVEHQDGPDGHTAGSDEAEQELIEHRAIRHAVIEAERDAILELRDTGQISDDVLRTRRARAGSGRAPNGSVSFSPRNLIRRAGQAERIWLQHPLQAAQGPAVDDAVAGDVPALGDRATTPRGHRSTSRLSEEDDGGRGEVPDLQVQRPVGVQTPGGDVAQTRARASRSELNAMVWRAMI